MDHAVEGGSSTRQYQFVSEEFNVYIYIYTSRVHQINGIRWRRVNESTKLTIAICGRWVGAIGRRQGRGDMRAIFCMSNVSATVATTVIEVLCEDVATLVDEHAVRAHVRTALTSTIRRFFVYAVWSWCNTNLRSLWRDGPVALVQRSYYTSLAMIYGANL